MAKSNNIDSAKIAMNSAAMAEKEKNKVSHDYGKLTQKNGTKQVNMKKFPEIWFNILLGLKRKDPTAPSVTGYALIAVREKMERDGLL